MEEFYLKLGTLSILNIITIKLFVILKGKIYLQKPWIFECVWTMKNFFMILCMMYFHEKICVAS